jgi:hypothetical protein
MYVDPTVVQMTRELAPVLGFAVGGWTLVAVIRAWRGTGKVVANKPPSAELMQPLEQRLQRLEQATDAIALQTERIAEGQRFVTKLLSDAEHQPPRLGAPR